MKTNKIKFIIQAFLVALTIPLVCIADTKSNKDVQVSDTWIQAKLVTTYALNRNLSIFDIGVDVRDQVAYLDGNVDSPIKKDLAGEIAKSIDGVKEVKNSIIVDASPSKVKSAENRSRSFGQVVDDLTTTASVKTKLLTDSNVKGLDINVDTENNNVTLRGQVGTDAERELIEKIASNTSGVKAVANKIEVKS